MPLAFPKGLKSYLVVLISLGFAVADIVSSTYVLDAVYEGETFFDNFDFTTASRPKALSRCITPMAYTSDPTHGFVNYISQFEAQQLGLISTGSAYGAYMGVDYTSTLDSTGTGRNSVRITSKDTFTHGLIISDITHQPGGICGTWPAHWTLGPSWPNTGEIDIIEGVNSQTDNLMSLHTNGSCTIAGDTRYQTGTTQTLDCDVYETGNVGCGTASSSSSSYGSDFNSVHGGVYATQWTSDYIRIWYFPRGSIPTDIQQQTPDPSRWGLPQANFQGSCDIDNHFQDHKIIFDTTFCGDLGANVWKKDAVCAPLATTCVDYVATNPAAFKQAYWAVNSVKVYQLQASDSVATISSSSIVTPPSAANSSAARVHYSNTASVEPTSLTTVVGRSSLIDLGMGASTASSGSAITPTSSLIFPTQTVASVDPYIIDTFFYLGCLGSSLGFPTFHQVSESLFMTPTLCVSQCGDFSYAGIYSTQCFCANELDTSTGQGNGTCSIPCPGFAKQVCGGFSGLTNSTISTSNITISSRFARRQIGALSSSILLTTYENLAPAAGGGGSGIGSSISLPASTPSPTIPSGPKVTIVIAFGPNYTFPIVTSSLVLTAGTDGVHYAPTGTSTVEASALTTIVPPANPSIIGLGMGGAFQITGVVVTTYTDICPTGLVVITTTSTITHCSCLDYLSSTAAPSIPMITTVKLCTACGSSGQSVTVTIPQGPSSIYIPATTTATVTSNGVGPGAGTEPGTIVYPVQQAAQITSNGITVVEPASVTVVHSAPTQVLPTNGPPAAVQQTGKSNPGGNEAGIIIGTSISPNLYPSSPPQAEVYNLPGTVAGISVPSGIQPGVQTETYIPAGNAAGILVSSSSQPSIQQEKFPSENVAEIPVETNINAGILTPSTVQPSIQQATYNPPENVAGSPEPININAPIPPQINTYKPSESIAEISIPTNIGASILAPAEVYNPTGNVAVIPLPSVTQASIQPSIQPPIPQETYSPSGNAGGIAVPTNINIPIPPQAEIYNQSGNVAGIPIPSSIHIPTPAEAETYNPSGNVVGIVVPTSINAPTLSQGATYNPSGNVAGIFVPVNTNFPTEAYNPSINVAGIPVPSSINLPTPAQAEIYNPTGTIGGIPVPSAVQPPIQQETYNPTGNVAGIPIPISSSADSIVIIYSTATVIPIAYTTPISNADAGNGIIVGYAHPNGSVTGNGTVIPLAYTGGAEKESLEIGLVGSFILILGVGWILM